jgi:hypothetical protein
VNAVLDKDGEEVFKTHDAKAAMAYLSQNYDKLKETGDDEAHPSVEAEERLIDLDKEVLPDPGTPSVETPAVGTEDNAPDMVVRDPEDEAEDKEQEIAKDQVDAEKINTELDRIKQLANIQ